MKKVKLQMQVSLDGFVAGPNGELDWMVWDWDQVLKNYANGLIDSADTLLIGRVAYTDMVNYWPAAARNSSAKEEEIEFAHKMNNISKIVFSKTRSSVEWNNSTLAQGNIQEEVAKLKQQPGKDIIIYGGAGIVSSFMKNGLIDEYHLFINPVVLGKGMSIFKGLDKQLKLTLTKTTTSGAGIVILCYVPAR